MGVLNLILQLKEESGIGFLYITHDLASARYIGDRTMVMYTGHIVESGESIELMENPHHLYSQLLLKAVPNPHAGLKAKTIQARGEVPPPDRSAGTLSVFATLSPGNGYLSTYDAGHIYH
jgi:peptide/nickel transport system ATP-binding protein